MKRLIFSITALVVILLAGCSHPGRSAKPVITVTIPPLEWFVKGIAGDDFSVNIMLPPGADHHNWEPVPSQIVSLSQSEAFVMIGTLEFERAWIERFREINPRMKVLDLSEGIELIRSATSSDDDHHEGHDDDHGDPHFWMSPVSAYTMAREIGSFLSAVNPGRAALYAANLDTLMTRIGKADSLMKEAAGMMAVKEFMIYHPALAYPARDYGLTQLSFENEGKEPSPARMKELIDTARAAKIKTIFIQAEYDVRNAESLSKESGATLVVINPMNRNWEEAVNEVARGLKENSR